MTVYVIGDIHGCFYEFQDLLQRVGPVSGDRVICLGDFLDKGPFGAECVRFARENGFDSVLGNHDERHLRWSRNERLRRERGRPNNMRPMLPSDAVANAKLTEEDLAWLQGLPRLLEVSVRGLPWVVVHGGLMPDVPIPEQDLDDVLRLRWIGLEVEGDFSSPWKTVPVDYERPETLGRAPEGAIHWTNQWDGPSNVVFGHEAFSLKEPLHVANEATRFSCWGIDTGAVHGGHLTALALDTSEVFQVRARREYMKGPVDFPWTMRMRQLIEHCVPKPRQRP